MNGGSGAPTDVCSYCGMASGHSLGCLAMTIHGDARGLQWEKASCRACAILERQVDDLREQVKTLQTHLVNLADPMALARVAQLNAQAERIRAPSQEARKPPTPPRVLGRTQPDRLSPGEEDALTEQRLREINATRPQPDGASVEAPTKGRPEIEASFEAAPAE